VRSLAELDTVDWAALGHASDVPELLRALTTDEHTHALTELSRTVTGGEAAAHVVPFLLGLATDPTTPDRAELVRFLGTLAIGSDAAFLPAGIDVEAWRAQAGPAELAAYEAVLAEASTVVELLDDPSPRIKVAALHVLGWLPSHESAPCVRMLLAGTEPDGVVASAVVTLGLLGVSPATVRPYLASPSPTVRWAAAIALARLGDLRPVVVETLAGFVAAPPPQTDPPVPFHDGDFRGYAALALGRVLKAI
jgi:hypothetical protein